eukprot:TRINITY_DN21911_c0_g1_i2.p1 TRINITY_DN21911_c0_g1~~TRINITY_DN21911_c0_g1_i2.p1  ORF type:complete len:412 (+),score=61.54 TRINITY_DN21911_c0_g1_i2:36-1271(+)
MPSKYSFPGPVPLCEKTYLQVGKSLMQSWCGGVELQVEMQGGYSTCGLDITSERTPIVAECCRQLLRRNDWEQCYNIWKHRRNPPLQVARRLAACWIPSVSHIIPESILYVSTPAVTKHYGPLLGWSAPVIATVAPPRSGTFTELRGEIRGIELTTVEGPIYMLAPFSVFVKNSNYLESKGVVSARCDSFDKFAVAVEEEIFNLEEVTTPSPRDPFSTFMSVAHYERLQRQQIRSLEVHARELLRTRLLSVMLSIATTAVSERSNRKRQRIIDREDLVFCELQKRALLEESEILSRESILSVIAPILADCKEQIAIRNRRIKRRASKIASLKKIIKQETESRTLQLAADAEEQELQRRKWEAEDFALPKSDFEVQCRNEWNEWFQQRSLKHLEKKTKQMTVASEALLNSFG